ncbi:hypothetical protein lerEdw1_020637 [Lerista edwardsae]|nr:hypothetical protein lerEdw1_020637 [Lerista edwardsae]
MGRKLDPTRKVKRGPGRKARKQRGAEEELSRFLPPDPEDGTRKLSTHARRRAAKRRIKLAEPQTAAKKSSPTEAEAKERSASADGGQASFSDDNARWLTPSASGKKRARPDESDEDSVELGGSEGNEGFLESEEEEDGSEDGMVDDYGALSSEEEDELLPIERAAQKQKLDGQDFSEDDSEEEEEEPSQHRQDVEQEQNEDMQLNLEADERFVLPSGQEIEKDILPLSIY